MQQRSAYIAAHMHHSSSLLSRWYAAGGIVEWFFPPLNCVTPLSNCCCNAVEGVITFKESRRADSTSTLREEGHGTPNSELFYWVQCHQPQL